MWLSKYSQEEMTMIEIRPRALMNITKAEEDDGPNLNDNGLGLMGNPSRPALPVRKAEDVNPPNLDYGIATLYGPAPASNATFRQTHRGLEVIEDVQSGDHRPGLFDNVFAAMNTNNAYRVRNPALDRVNESSPTIPTKDKVQKRERIRKFELRDENGIDLSKLWDRLEMGRY